MSSKLGFNLLAGYDPNDLNPALDEQMHSILLLQEFRDKIATVITNTAYPVVRIFHRDGRYAEDHLVSGWMRYTENHIGLQAEADFAQSKGKHLWLQGPNEVHASVEYGRFEAERALALYDIGARAVIGNFSVGTPSSEAMLEFWLGYYSYLNEVDRLDVKAGIGFHEYGYIWPWTWLGPFQGENIHPNEGLLPAIPKPGEKGWLVGRFQDSFYIELADALKWRLGLSVDLMDNFKIFITEAGLDLVTSEKWNLPKKQLSNGLEVSFSGWRTCAPYWKNYFVSGGPEMYGRLLQWLDDYYHQFEQVVAVLVFGLGPHHDNDFEDFDIGGNNQKIIQMMLDSKPTSEVVPPSTPPIPPAPVLSRREWAKVARLWAGIKKRTTWITDAQAQIAAIYDKPE